MKVSALIIFLSGFCAAKFQWKKQYSKGQTAKSKCRVNYEIWGHQSGVTKSRRLGLRTLFSLKRFVKYKISYITGTLSGIEASSTFDVLVNGSY